MVGRRLVGEEGEEGVLSYGTNEVVKDTERADISIVDQIGSNNTQPAPEHKTPSLPPACLRSD